MSEEEQDRTLLNEVTGELSPLHSDLNWARTPDELLQQLRDQSHCLVICDYPLLSTRNHDLLKRLREFSSSLPVLCLSNVNDVTTANELLRNGATRYLLRDNVNQIVDVISELMDHEARDESAAARYRQEMHLLEHKVLTHLSRSKHSVESILSGFITGMENIMPGTIPSVVRIKDNKMKPWVASSRLSGQFLSLQSGTPIGPQSGTCGAAADSKEMVITEDIFSHESWSEARDFAKEEKLAASWSFPVLKPDGEVYATFCTYYRKSKAPTGIEVEVLNRARNLLQIIIQFDQSRKKIQYNELRFRSLVQDGADLIAILDQEGNYIYTAPSSTGVLGITPEEFAGTNALDYVHPDDRDTIREQIASLKPGDRLELQAFRFRDGDDNWRWLESTLTNRFHNPAINGIVANSRDVTEQIEREKALNESLKRYDYATKATQDTIYDWDLTTETFIWNSRHPNALRDVNEKRKSTIDVWKVRVHPDDLQEVYSDLMHTLHQTDRTEWNYEYRFSKSDGSYAHTYERGFIIRDDGGKAIRMIGSLQDITNRKANETRLEELSLVASKTTDIIVRTDARGYTSWVNPAFEKVTGYSAEFMIGKKPGEVLYGPDTDPETIQRISQAIRDRKSIQEVILNYARDGSEYWLDITIDPVFNEKGECTGFIAIEKDVTTQMNRQKQLHESVKRFQSVSKATSDTIWELDLKADKIVYNQNIYNMFGYQKHEVNNTGEWWRTNIHPGDRSKVYMEIEKATAEQTDRFQIYYRFKASDNSYRYIYDRAFIVTDENDKPVKIIGAMQDVTEQRTHEQQLRRSLKEKETLLMEIHHRVKNNLAVVSSMLQLQMINSEETSGLAQKLQDSIYRIKTMSTIHELLYQSRSFTHLDMKKNLKRLIEDITTSLHPEKSIRLDLNLSPLLLNINQALPCSLIVNEVITNAVKHGFRNRNKGEIVVDLTSGKKLVKLQISDDGRGFPDQFDPDDTDSLGMTLIRTLVSQLHGDYNFETRNGMTTFNLEFTKNELRGSGNAHL